MGYQFIECERDQRFLLPEDMRDWLPKDDICWFLIDVVEKMDLSHLYLRYNADSMGRKAYDPRMLLCLMIYAYSVGERSSRRIEALCKRDISFRVITGNKTPDHTTICRFRKDNAKELEAAFTEALGLCVEQGVLSPKVIAIDGTRIGANASMDRNMEVPYERVAETVRGWLKEAERIDEEEDRFQGPENRENKVPAWLRDPKRRREVIDEYFERAREPEEAEKAQREAIARRKAEEKRTGKKKGGPRQKTSGEIRSLVNVKKRKPNTTDPDSRIMKDSSGHLQGYNAQVAVNEDQFIVAAELHKESSDAQLLHPLIENAEVNLEKAACAGKIKEVVADANYVSEDNVIRENITEYGRVKEDGPRRYIATKKDRHLAKELKETPIETGKVPEDELSGWEKMVHRHRSERGRELFKIRGTTVELVFG